MRWSRWSASLPGIALLLTFAAAPAHAQATRTWVSGVGDDANPCSRTAPCKTFAGSISKTAAGGEINCIDAGAYGAVTITKSITIDCFYTQAGVLASGTNGIVVNAGINDTVTLRGLDIFSPIASPGINGVSFLAGHTLSIERCRIRQFQAQSPTPAGFGVAFRPSTGTSELYISDTVITQNGGGSVGGAVLIQPSGSGAVRGIFDNINAHDNIAGIVVDSALTTGAISLSVRDATVAGSTLGGVLATSPASGGGLVRVLLYNSTFANNNIGVNAVGPKSAIVMSGLNVSGNTTGMSATSSGQIFTYQNNNFNDNGANGSSSGNLTPL